MVKKLAGDTGAALEAMDWLNYPCFGRFQDGRYYLQHAVTDD